MRAAAAWRAGLLAAALALGGCTTVASGIGSAPPGINRHSFRECLLRDGFFTGPALIGGARDGFVVRHAADKTQRDLATIGDAAFAAMVAVTIRNGLFPHLQYGIETTQAAAGPQPGYDPRIAEPVANRPYIVDQAGGVYDPAAPPGVPVAAGEPPRPDLPVDRFLDCYVAPVGRDEPGLSTTGDYDREGRLLRAHVLLAVLGAYGTELVTSTPSKRQAEQATRLLGHLRDAELSIRSASAAMNPDLARYAVAQGIVGQEAAADGTVIALVEPADRPGPNAGLRWYAYATRLLRLFQVAVDVEVVDARQSLDRLSNIIAAFSAPTPGAFDSVLRDAVRGLATLQKVQLYGTALRLDGAETLAEHRTHAATAFPADATALTIARWRYDLAVERRLWGLWDARLERSCHLLSSVARQVDAGCLPKQESMKDALAAALPPGAAR